MGDTSSDAVSNSAENDDVTNSDSQHAASTEAPLDDVTKKDKSQSKKPAKSKI